MAAFAFRRRSSSMDAGGGDEAPAAAAAGEEVMHHTSSAMMWATVSIEDDGYDPRDPKFIVAVPEEEKVRRELELAAEQTRRLEQCIARRWAAKGCTDAGASEVVSHYKNVAAAMENQKSAMSGLINALLSPHSMSTRRRSSLCLVGPRDSAVSEASTEVGNWACGFAMDLERPRGADLSTYTWSHSARPPRFDSDAIRQQLGMVDEISRTRTRSRSPPTYKASGARPCIRDIFADMPGGRDI